MDEFYAVEDPATHKWQLFLHHSEAAMLSILPEGRPVVKVRLERNLDPQVPEAG